MGCDSRYQLDTGRLPVTLRRTRKLASVLALTTEDAPPSSIALGDWYANRLVVDRKPLLLLVSSRSLLPILLPARDLRTLPSRLGDVVAQRLRRFGIERHLIDAEVGEMTPVHVTKTADRAVVGIMVDFAFAAAYHLPRGAWDDTTLPFVEAALAETPCFCSSKVRESLIPERATRELLEARWGAGG
ncbi:MAG: DUF6933 domain-containing protein [Gemmatimonadaceae bacterium]